MSDSCTFAIRSSLAGCSVCSWNMIRGAGWRNHCRPKQTLPCFNYCNTSLGPATAHTVFPVLPWTNESRCKFLLCFTSLPLSPILSQNNPLHTTPSYLSNIHFNIIHPPAASSGLSLLAFPQIRIPLLHSCYMPYPSSSLTCSFFYSSPSLHVFGKENEKLATDSRTTKLETCIDE
jgi:hypothetical protein